MNIIARPYGSDMCYCRPDTTWERENKDLYSPECVNEWYWAPVMFVRISKAGKCINPKFASRYYDAFNFGALLYIGGQPTAFASCADHSSILPSPLYNPLVMEDGENSVEYYKNEAPLFKTCCDKGKIEESLCKASVLTSLRIGDFMAVELAEPEPLASVSDSKTSFTAVFCEKEIFGFDIIF